MVVDLAGSAASLLYGHRLPVASKLSLFAFDYASHLDDSMNRVFGL